MKIKRLGLRESIIHATDIGVVEDYALAATRCTHMSGKTRRAIARAADKRRRELFDAERASK